MRFPANLFGVEADAEILAARIAGAINAILLDMLAAVARKDDEGRRRRQAQAHARVEGRYKGQPENA